MFFLSFSCFVFVFFVFLVEKWRSFKHCCEPVCLFLAQSAEAGASAGLVCTWPAEKLASASIVADTIAEGATCFSLLLHVEGLRLLEDVLAIAQVFEGLSHLLGGVEALRLLEDVHAAEETLDRLAHLLGG